MPQLSCPNLSELARGVNKSGNGEVGEPESVPLAGVNPAWLDVAFTDRPISCDQDDGTCDEMGGCFGRYREDTKRDSTSLYSM